MAEHIHLRAYQVRQLLDVGQCEWRRTCLTGAPLLHEIGAQLAVRERVAKPKKDETAYRYEADGREPGYFYLPNYQMPQAACRLRVEVVASWLELHPAREIDDLDDQVQCFTLHRLDDVPA